MIAVLGDEGRGLNPMITGIADLPFYSTPEGKKELARTLVTAVHEKGFLVLLAVPP